jgi:hypothetical protein
MIAVEDCLVSEDIVVEQFACNVSACKGACCIEGDAGAPLAPGEASIIEKNIDAIKTEMDKLGLETLDKIGVSETDSFEEEVTTCKPNNECTFAIRQDGVLSCGIEVANNKNNFGFAKPISCQLYPIRVKKYGDYHALNYHRWSVCSDACDRGKKEKISVYEFCKAGLVRKFGNSWYKKLEELASEFLKTKAG